jgi:hypothetical protein
LLRLESLSLRRVGAGLGEVVQGIAHLTCGNVGGGVLESLSIDLGQRIVLHDEICDMVFLERRVCGMLRSRMKGLVTAEIKVVKVQVRLQVRDR